jgi:hypothetical protein
MPHFGSDSERIYYYGFVQADPVPGAAAAPPPTLALSSARWDDTEKKVHLRVTARVDVSAGGIAEGYRISETSDLVEPQANFEDDSEARELIPERSAGMVMMAPQGDLALAQIGSDLYAVTVPPVSGIVPTVQGVEFPTWSADGPTANWSLGNALFSYDLDAASGDDGYAPAEQQFSVSATRDIPQGTVILRGARAITMNGAEVIENADIVVVNNRITSVTSGAGDVPEGAQVLDVRGKTNVPGFVDTHAHMWNLWGFPWARPWI